MQKNNYKILIVDDEEDICKLIQDILQDEGYHVEYATNVESALKKFKEGSFHLSILDVWLHDSADDGIRLMERFLDISPTIPIIMMSGHSTVETAVQAIKKGAYDFIEKPFKTDRLLVIVQRGIELRTLKHENKALKDRKTDTQPIVLLGESSVFKSFHKTVLKAAESQNPVLIYGGSGVGKKTIAQYIHQNSPNRDHPCRVMNCADGSLEDQEQKLFDALEQAHHGTLILDGISDLSLATQKAFLSVLEGQKILNVRIIGTYDVDILDHIKKGYFLSDLFYMLNVIPLKIPFLRERAEDIPLLINHFYRELDNTQNDIAKRFTHSALSVLQAYSWSGNIKQLKNFVEWLKIVGLAKNKSIDVDDLPPYLTVDTPQNTRQPDSDFLEDCLVFSLKEAREKFEKNYLQEQLVRFGYNISKASVFIGMERSALHRKLKSLGIESSSESTSTILGQSKGNI